MEESYKWKMLQMSKCLLVLLFLFGEGAFLAWTSNHLFVTCLLLGSWADFLLSTAVGWLQQRAGWSMFLHNIPTPFSGLTRVYTKEMLSERSGCLAHSIVPLCRSTGTKGNLSIRDEQGWNPQPLAVTPPGFACDSWQQLARRKGRKSSGKLPP